DESALGQLIGAHNLGDDILWLGHVPPGALRHLYEKALALCFPSEFEGFGMPLVEAMYCNCPVIANQAASSPGICGDAAMFVPPRPELWAESIATIVDDETARADLIEKGRRQAQRFTVEALAEETIKLIDGAVDAFRGPEIATPPVSFAVIAGPNSRPLELTLKNLALAVGEHDQVFVVADATRFDNRIRSLIENFEQVEVVDHDDDWTARMTADFAMVLGAGATIVDGALNAACQALTLQPSRRLA